MYNSAIFNLTPFLWSKWNRFFVFDCIVTMMSLEVHIKDENYSSLMYTLNAGKLVPSL